MLRPKTYGLKKYGIYTVFYIFIVFVSIYYNIYRIFQQKSIVLTKETVWYRAYHKGIF